MRQLILQVAKGNEEAITQTAEKYKGKNTIFLPGAEKDVFFLFLPNNTINSFLKDV